MAITNAAIARPRPTPSLDEDDDVFDPVATGFEPLASAEAVVEVGAR